MTTAKLAAPDGSTMLRNFMALADDKPKTLRFARRWGLLGLCHHRLPATHRSSHRLSQIHLAVGEVDAPADAGVGRLGDRVLSEEARTWLDAVPDIPPCREAGSESLEDWWFWSRHAAAVVTCAERLRRGEPCAAEQIGTVTDLLPAYWPEMVFPDPPAAGAADLAKAEVLQRQRDHVARVVQQWLEIAEVTIAIEWKPPQRPTDPTRPILGYHGAGLFAALAIEIALSVTTASGFYICDYCGRSYTRLRAPQAGKHGYCPDCKGKGAQATWRAADPDRRVREAEARKRRVEQAANAPRQDSKQA
jgi:hypothetical protein